MNRVQWQIYHGFDDEDMDLIVACVEIFSGKITRIKDIS
jgi:hypothetical protein